MSGHCTQFQALSTEGGLQRVTGMATEEHDVQGDARKAGLQQEEKRAEEGCNFHSQLPIAVW